jgi:hypothetical protein
MAGVGVVLNLRSLLLLILRQPAGTYTRTVLVGCYLAGLALSIWWLMLLRRPMVEQQFAERGRKPRT